MAAQAAARGKKALEDKDFATAILEFTTAIKDAPTSPDFFNQRSIANQRQGNYEAALRDAEQGVLNGTKRAKREAIIEAQLRRGIALHKLNRFADAEFCLKLVKQRVEKHPAADMWLNLTRKALEKLPQDDKQRKITITEIPAEQSPSEGQASTGSTASVPASSSDPGPPPASAVPAVTTVQQTPADKIRYEWYQNTDKVYFSLLAKGVPKDKAQIEFKERSLNISFPLITGSDYDLTLEPLFGPIDIDQCEVSIKPSKIDIVLKKATTGFKWSSLEDPTHIQTNTTTTDSTAGNDTNNTAERAVLADTTAKEKLPAYPTSSKRGPKNWDKIAADLRHDKPGSKKSATADDDDDDDYEGGDEANHFFQKLFKGASPEMQRAMMKSYTESNGTALSTNWEEVSKGPVETTPPDGMEAKQWSR